VNASWERIRAVFHAALAQPAGTRTRVLLDACEGDELIRREVESLLAAHDAAHQFLESPAVTLGGGPVVQTATALQAGTRIGNFHVVGPLGSGGMGEVYRARDEKLRRDVALKLLPRALAADPERLARFERESRLLAALNHPHIATIHSVEHADGVDALVMELIEGPTLAERLARGSLGWRDALAIARELAGALEAAHDKGLVHRDLKPANIKFTASGSLKLLDFGLAKDRAEPEGEVDRSSADSVDPLKTTDGWVLGTCAYMSPEQALGLAVDKRTDIWAFGCVLFEMLTVTRAFRAGTAAETIDAVLTREADWTFLPAAMPAGILRLLRRCLDKNRQQRLHDIADVRIEIDDLLQARDSDAPSSAAAGSRPALRRLGAVAGLVAAGAAAGWWLRATMRDDPSTPKVSRSTWSLPAGAGLTSAPAISPDGQHIAFTARAKGEPPRLFVRALGSLEARAIEGTLGAEHPFWSPDSRSIGYFAPGKVMKVAIDGGSPVELCATRAGRGGSWTSNGIIVFAPDMIDSGLAWISAAGGRVHAATVLDRAQGENSHRWPQFLPDGLHFLYFVHSSRDDRRGVYIGRIDRPAALPGAPLFRSENEARYVSLTRHSGLLLSAANGHIEVRGFDPYRRRITGDPAVLDVAASGLGIYHASMFSISPDGLVHVAATIPFGQRFASVNRDGSGLTVQPDRKVLNWPRLSPDGLRVVVQEIDGPAKAPALIVEDLTRGNRVKVTGDGVAGLTPVWSPDGQRLAYLTAAVPGSPLVIGAADGIGPTTTVPCPGVLCSATDWTSAGLLATVLTEKGSPRGGPRDVWMLSTAGGEPSRPLLAESFVERDARFSPDGRFVAYVSEETGRPEVSIQRIDGHSAREVISVGGGDQPVWRRDGRELFFVDPKGMLRAVSVERGPGGRPVAGTPALLGVPPIGFGHSGTQYDVSLDGQRIYLFDRRSDPAPSEIGVVLGWRALLKQSP
jgi:serine/threonine protein kinase